MEKTKKIRFIYGICFAALTVIVGLVFIIEIADLYYSAIAVDPSASPYTVENISSHLVVPIVFLCIWIAAVIAAFVLSVVFPTKEAKVKYVNNERTLSLLKTKIRDKGNEGHVETIETMNKFETFRLMLRGMTLCILLSCASYILFYVYNPQNFHADGFKSDIMELVRSVLIWMALGFIFTVFASVVESIVIKWELSEAKVAISSGDKNSGFAEIKPRPLIAILMMIFALACISLMLLVIFAFSPIGYRALTGNGSSVMPPVFILIGLAAASIVYILIERFNKKTDVNNKKTQIYCSVAAGAIALITVVLYIIAPPLLTMLMNKLSGSIVYFVAPALILIIAGFVLYRTLTKFVPQKVERIMTIATRASIAIVAVSFIIAGIVNGGANDVLLKAINICTECIGLG